MPLPPSPADRLPAVEWPTLALVLLIHTALLALIWFHNALPIWLWIGLAAWFSAWWGSIQHEILHGHPTRSRAINTALATPPYWLWLPFERYRQTHLTHHRNERLTDPLDDPESRYLTPEAWAALGPIMRAIVAAQGTLLGRMVIGPVMAPLLFIRDEARAIAAGNLPLARIWARHTIWTLLLAFWTFVVAGIPVWQYFLGVVYGGMALALVRSFAEHRADPDEERRTAVVERSPVFGLLFLFNNLHVVHHRWPSVPWYRLPGLYRRHREAFLALNGGLLYRGYADVFRHFLFCRHDVPVHPMGRIPAGGPAMPAADSFEPSPPRPIPRSS